MTIPLFRPTFSVTLFKNIDHQTLRDAGSYEVAAAGEENTEAVEAVTYGAPA